MRARLAIALAPALLIAGAAAAQTQAPPAPQETSIPFATHNGIQTFAADDDGHGIYLQDRRRNWYYAALAGPCMDLPFAIQIGFQTFGGSTSLTRGDTIIARGDRCLITSLTASGPPPKKAKKDRKKR